MLQNTVEVGHMPGELRGSPSSVQTGLNRPFFAAGSMLKVRPQEGHVARLVKAVEDSCLLHPSKR
jgi:hypothetical protein